jgi:hypothetical protein
VTSRSDRHGTGVVDGFVGDHRGRPLRHVAVHLTASRGGQSVDTVTDDRGRFRLVNLPSSDYLLSFAKPGFVPLRYGQNSAFDPPAVLRVVNGSASSVTMRLSQGGVIVGHLTDERHESVGGALVRARFKTPSGAP